MSEYIEDRISSLENRVSDIERHYNFLNTRVNNLVDDVHDNADDITLLRGDLGKMGKEIDILRCEVRGTEYLDPLTDKPIDQSTEEFVKVTRCKDCAYWGEAMNDAGYRYCYENERNTCDDDYCSRGEKR